jgi:hypothetical protein
MSPPIYTPQPFGLTSPPANHGNGCASSDLFGSAQEILIEHADAGIPAADHPSGQIDPDQIDSPTHGVPH